MREQFFSLKGLTSTSANHVANLAKEYIQSQKVFLNNLTFVGENIQAGGHTYIGSCATPVEEFNKLIPTLNKISQATQLIAWLREALKEKQNYLEHLPTLEQWASINNEAIPVTPQLESHITREDVIKGWDVNKYNAYITAQTFATVFGEAIHPTGMYSSARKELTNAISHPSSIEGQGRDLTVTTQVPAYTLDTVDTKFFELQNIQREHQAKFNQYEHEITSAVDADTAKKASDYYAAYDAYQKAYGSLYNKYNAWLNVERKRLADLKIAIPEALSDIFTEISGLGK